jgi:hypothetical protein
MAESDKRYKVQEHQRERSQAKIAIAKGDDPKPKHEYGGSWNSEKDGKAYFGDRHPKLLRK